VSVWVGAWPKDDDDVVIIVFVVVVVIFVVVEALGHTWGLLGRCFLFL
jgi:hypothetical protein